MASACSLGRWIAIVVLCAAAVPAAAADMLNILRFAPAGSTVDRTGHIDASAALAASIRAANLFTARGEPACVYIPPGIYRIMTAPPAFVRAGCVKGDGTTQSTLRIDPAFEGDLFAWSEAWAVTTPGPAVVGLKIVGNRAATKPQNAMVFYDRNDNVFIDDVEVDDLAGRALFSGVRKYAPQSYMRESHMRSLRFFNDGTPERPVLEFCSQGAENGDATNEIQLSQLDIYGSGGPSFVIRNNGRGAIRDVMIEGMRIEGSETGKSAGDLIDLGDLGMTGSVNNIRFSDVELIDPAANFAAIRLTAAPGATVPYQITFQGMIGGGLPRGEGIRIDAGRTSIFRLSGIHTKGANVVLGDAVNGILLDGGGQERQWTIKASAHALQGVWFPAIVQASLLARRPAAKP